MIEQPNTINSEFVEKVFSAVMRTLYSFNSVIIDPEYSERMAVLEKMKIVVDWPKVEHQKRREVMVEVLKSRPSR